METRPGKPTLARGTRGQKEPEPEDERRRNLTRSPRGHQPRPQSSGHAQDYPSSIPHHLLLASFEPLRRATDIFGPLSTETRSPFRQTGSPLTGTEPPYPPPPIPTVSLQSNRITSRIIQLFCSQAENVQTAAAMRAPFPPGKWRFTSRKGKKKYFAIKAIIPKCHRRVGLIARQGWV